jgi:hypothetical protein
MLVLFGQMDGSMASGIGNEKATTDVDDSTWDAFDISSSEDEYEIPSSDDDDSIFGDPVSESDNVSHSHFHILSVQYAWEYLVLEFCLLVANFVDGHR